MVVKASADVLIDIALRKQSSFAAAPHIFLRASFLPLLAPAL